MGKRKASSTLVCARGNPIARELKTNRPDYLRVGMCQACGVGPLHSVANGSCHCSFLRGKRRFCRDCAIAYDYVTQGFTRIKDVPVMPDEWKVFIDVHSRGVRAVLSAA